MNHFNLKYQGAVAAALFSTFVGISGSAQAADINSPMNDTIVETFLQKEPAPNTSPSSPSSVPLAVLERQAIPGTSWNISGNQVVSLTDLADTLSLVSAKDDGAVLAGAIIQHYRTKGFVSVQARVDGPSHTIRIVEPESRISGKYADYLPDVSNRLLTQSDLTTAIARARQAATANGEKLSIRVEPLSSDNTVRVILDGQPTGNKSWGGSAVASTLGPRYAASNVITLSGYQHLGSGITLDGSYSYGLSDLSSDSKGGNYSGISAGITQASPYGNFGLRISDVNFKVGGKNLPLDQTGKVTTIEGNWNYLVNDHFRVGAKVMHNQQKTRLGLYDFEDQITTNAVQANAGYSIKGDDYAVAVDGYVESGLSAEHDTKSPVPLYDTIYPHYKTAGLNASGVYQLHPSGWNVEAKFGGQKASEGTPPSSQFYVGGPDRGSSYHTGVLAGPSGLYGAITLVAPKVGMDLVPGFKGLVPFIGIDGGKVKWANGNSKSVSSVNAGVRFDFGEYGSGIIGGSTALNPETEDAKGWKLMFMWSMPF